MVASRPCMALVETTAPRTCYETKPNIQPSQDLGHVGDRCDQSNFVFPSACVTPNLLCSDGVTCVDESKVCDGESDCPGGFGEDEEDCVHLRKSGITLYLSILSFFLYSRAFYSYHTSIWSE
jgi:hypothetical protein